MPGERETAGAPPGRARVLAVLDLLIGWFAEPDYRGCAVVNTVTDTRADPRTAAIARRHLTRYRGLLERRLGEAGLPAAADPAALARQLLLLIEGASVVTSVDGTATARAAAMSLLPADAH